MIYKELQHHIKFKMKNYSLFSFILRIPCVIALFDGKEGKSGLADRLRHCLSLYLFCKYHNLSFKIHHISPFRLNHILLPNKVNWVLNDSDFSKSIYRTRTMEIKSYYKALSIDENTEGKAQFSQLSRLIKSCKYQYHIYGNAHFLTEQWKEAFDELFIPSKELNNLINGLKLPISYEAVTLRFQQLLGDFKEDGFPILPELEQNKLIEKCVKEIEYLKNSMYFKTDIILVTSDSVKFLNRIKMLPYIKVIEGERAHPGTPLQHTERTFLNSFVDLFALKNAKKVTLLKTGEMYLSGFPEIAARIGNQQYVIHSF